MASVTKNENAIEDGRLTFNPEPICPARFQVAARRPQPSRDVLVHSEAGLGRAKIA